MNLFGPKRLKVNIEGISSLSMSFPPLLLLVRRTCNNSGGNDRMPIFLRVMIYISYEILLKLHIY